MSEPSGLIVRIADADDAASISLLRSLWHGEEEPGFQMRIAHWLAGEGERRTTWLATLHDLPVGMASLFEYRRMPWPGRPDSRWGYVSNMFVREYFRNRQIGSALLARLIATAEERAYARLVVSPSDPAVPFYRRAGFVAPTGTGGADLLLLRPSPQR
jgi:GNAT superfamily N-acetyltransferase